MTPQTVTHLARLLAVLAGAAGAYFTAAGNAVFAAPCVYLAGHLAGWTQQAPKDRADRVSKAPASVAPKP